jgi:hypothetical protein
VAWTSTRTSLHALYHRIARRRGKPRAMLAVAHRRLVSIYYRLRDHLPYHDLGPDYFDHLPAQRLERHYIRRLEALGFPVHLTPTSSPTARVRSLSAPNHAVREQDPPVTVEPVHFQAKCPQCMTKSLKECRTLG